MRNDPLMDVLRSSRGIYVSEQDPAPSDKAAMWSIKIAFVLLFAVLALAIAGALL